MNKKIIATAACAVLALALTGCGSKAEEPNLPNPNASASSSGYTVTDASKLKSLSVGESAVWRDYEVAVKSIDRANDQPNVQIEVKAHPSAQELSTDCLLSFRMPPVRSTFANHTLPVPAGATASAPPPPPAARLPWDKSRPGPLHGRSPRTTSSAKQIRPYFSRTTCWQ